MSTDDIKLQQELHYAIKTILLNIKQVSEKIDTLETLLIILLKKSSKNLEKEKKLNE